MVLHRLSNESGKCSFSVIDFKHLSPFVNLDLKDPLTVHIQLGWIRTVRQSENIC